MAIVGFRSHFLKYAKPLVSTQFFVRPFVLLPTSPPLPIGTPGSGMHVSFPNPPLWQLRTALFDRRKASCRGWVVRRGV